MNATTPASNEVTLEGVSKAFGPTTVLQDLDLTIGAGELVTVLGPSGCGKTTALRILAGFEKPTDGRVLVGGRELTQVPPNRRGIGMVFQAYSLFPNMTVQDNVEYGLRVRKVDAVGERIFVEGNAAAALGCVYGGATVCAWYPITPSSSLAEAFAKYCGKYRSDADGKARHAIIQAEDEIASIGMVVGAGWNGARAFTATSGPGISLMNEFIGLAYFAEIPVTIIDVQRGGPSTGMPTRTQQSDLTLCAYASHGDTKHVLLLPEDPHECFAFAADALDLADRLQTPIFVMTDLDIGMNQRLCAPFEWDDARTYDRGKVLTAEDLDAGKVLARYRDLDGDGIPYRTWPGTHPDKGAYFTRGTSRNPEAIYSERGPDYVYNMERLLQKWQTARTLVPQPVVVQSDIPARHGAIFFGSTSPAMAEAIALLQDDGIALDTLRVRAFPFPEAVRAFIDAHESVFVVEQNRDGQLRALLVNEFGIDPARLVAVLHYDGTPITARFIAGAVVGHVRPVSREDQVA